MPTLPAASEIAELSTSHGVTNLASELVVAVPPLVRLQDGRDCAEKGCGLKTHVKIRNTTTESDAVRCIRTSCKAGEHISRACVLSGRDLDHRGRRAGKRPNLARNLARTGEHCQYLRLSMWP